MKKIICILSFMFFVFSFVMLGSPLTVNASEIEDKIETEENFINDENAITPMSGGSDSSGDGSNNEDWYDISVSNGIPQLPHSVDYSTKEGLIKYLKPGDLVYEPVGGMGITGHTAMVYDILYSEEYEQYYVVLIEAVSDGVSYGLLTPTRFIEKECEITRLTNANQSQIMDAIDWAQSQIGKSYWIDTTKNPSEENPNWYCSELVWASFYWQGIYLDQDDNNASNGSIVWPSEINDYSYAKLIMHYQYDTTYSSINDSFHTITCNNEMITESHDYSELNCCYDKCLLCNHIKQISSHDYTFRYSKLDSENHYAYCECGTYSVEEHIFEETATSKVCIDCGYREYINHEHFFKYTSCGDGMYHYKSCFCGQSTREACIGFTQIDGTANCSKCGQLIGGFGPILMNEEGLVTAVPAEGFVIYINHQEEFKIKKEEDKDFN